LRRELYAHGSSEKHPAIHPPRKNSLPLSDKGERFVKAARTVDEASELISVGFVYVTEVEGFKLFRKHPRNSIFFFAVTV
jgi:hypothetical protein